MDDAAGSASIRMRSRYRKIRARASISRQSKARGRSRRQSKARGSSHGLSKVRGGSSSSYRENSARESSYRQSKVGCRSHSQSTPPPLAGGGKGEGASRHLHKPPVLHIPLHPPSFPLHELPYRQRVEELVRH
jgi:hypothetical protein